MTIVPAYRRTKRNWDINVNKSSTIAERNIQLTRDTFQKKKNVQ